MASKKNSVPCRSPPPATRVPCYRRSELPSLRDPQTQDVFHSIVSGRKNWKTLRGGEIVWPPELEAALIEGLESYEPDDSRETRLLGRYPMRNRFISEHIYNKTGVKRTPKQVGSRLQQLRDRCTGKKLMKLLSPSRPIGAHDKSDTDDSSSDGSSLPTTPIDAAFPNFDHTVKPPRTVVIIDILPEPACSRRMSHDPNPSTEDAEHSADEIIRPDPHPRPFRSIDPTVTFIGPSQLSAQSICVVKCRGVIVFNETTRLTSIGSPPGRKDGARLYSTKLVPEFWGMICTSSDPTQYIIEQEVIQHTPSRSTMFSAVYKFCYSSTPTEPSCHPSPIHDHSDEMQPIFDIPSPASLDSFLSMDVSMDIPSFNVTECGSSDSCYDFSNLSQDVWAINPPSPISTDLSGCSPSLFSINLSTCSPSHFSADPSTCYERYFSDSYPSPPMTLSPASPSFSLDLSHFVS